MCIIYYNLLKLFVYKKYNVKLPFYTIIFYLLIDLYFLYSNNLLFYIFLTILLTQSIFDLINYDVYSLLNILLLIVGILFRYQYIKTNIIPTIIITLSFCLINVLNKGIGTGDIELIAIISIVFNYIICLKVLSLASMSNLLFALFYQKDKYPFVPFIFVAFIIVIFY